MSGIYLVIGSLLVVEIAQDRSGAPAALRRRAFCDVAARPELHFPRPGAALACGSEPSEHLSAFFSGGRSRLAVPIDHGDQSIRSDRLPQGNLRTVRNAR